MTARKLNMTDLESIYLDGFCSGIASAIMNAGATPEEADAFANTIAESVRLDPAGIAEVRQQILERLTVSDWEHIDSRTVEIAIGCAR